MITPIEINQSEYITKIIITMSQKEVFQKIKSYKNNPDEIKSLTLDNEIICVSTLEMNDSQDNKHYGIVIFTININKILESFNILKKGEFFIKLKDNKCHFTNKTIPYLYHYSNRQLKIL